MIQQAVTVVYAREQIEQGEAFYRSHPLPVDNSLAIDRAIDVPSSIAADGASGLRAGVSSQCREYPTDGDSDPGEADFKGSLVSKARQAGVFLQ